MKALIIYDNITSALRAVNSLRNAALRTDMRVDWEINLWRANMLKFRSTAEEALTEAAAADLLVFAGCRTCWLPPWLTNWLENWAERRQVRDAALALLDDVADGPGPEMRSSELFQFAERHDLGFVTNKTASQRADQLPLPRVAFNSSRKTGHADTADFFREISRRLEKSPWMAAARLQEKDRMA